MRGLSGGGGRRVGVREFGGGGGFCGCGGWMGGVGGAGGEEVGL